MSSTNTIFKKGLCLIIAILISLMELQFFADHINIIIVILVFILTIPTIYLYFLPKHETMIIFLYTIVLVYILDLLGKDVNIYLFLTTLFTVVLLYLHSLYTANVERTNAKNPKYLTYIIILSLVFILVSVLSYIIYEYILKPNTDNQNKLALVYEEVEDSQEEIDDIKDEKNQTGGSGSSDSMGKEDRSLWEVLILLLILSILLLLLYILYKYLRYKIWLRKTLSLPVEKQVVEFYKYFLTSLNLLNLGRMKGETPLEYLRIIESKNFPYNREDFINLTERFMEVEYASLEIDKGEYEEVLSYFYRISKSLRKKLGLRSYIFKYLIKI